MFGGGAKTDAREGMTLIGEEAHFHGSLVAKGSLRVEGVFEGDITDARSIELLASGRLTGDIRCPKIRIEEGAYFDGSCAMGAEGEKPRRRRRAETDEPQPADQAN